MKPAIFMWRSVRVYVEENFLESVDIVPDNSLVCFKLSMIALMGVYDEQFW